MSWSGVGNATAYILEEAISNTFADAQQVYSGADTSFPASGRGAARYYYRVKARNSSWLQVYDQDHQLLAQDEHVTRISLSNQAPGKYYIRIYTNSGFSSSVPYTLKAVY